MNLDNFLFICRISKRYAGCRYIRYAIELINEAEDKCLITKDIYPKIAQRYDVSPATVEHDIRTIMRILWESNRDIIKPLFGYMPNKRPNNFQFLDALAFAYKTICTQEDFPNKELCPANQVIQADFE